MASSRYVILVDELESARAALLPPTFDDPTQFTQVDYDRARGFVVLAHAEIESFIEDRVLETANKAITTWLSTNSTCHA